MELYNNFWNGIQIQTVCFDNLGLLLAAILNILLKNNQRFFLHSHNPIPII